MEALDLGCKVVPATGRPVSGVPKELLALPGIDYAVTANGATVFRLTDLEPVFTQWIPQKDMLAAWAAIADLRCMRDVFVLGKAYNAEGDLARVERWAPPGMAAYLRARSNMVESLDAFAATQTAFEKGNLFFLDEDERQEARRRLEALDLFEITSSVSNNLELNAKGVNKGKALLALGELLGLGRGQIMACGDAGNDLEMLRAVGLGVAMGNAEPDIKAAASWVSATNEEDGVALAVEKFVLQKM